MKLHGRVHTRHYEWASQLGHDVCVNTSVGPLRRIPSHLPRYPVARADLSQTVSLYVLGHT